ALDVLRAALAVERPEPLRRAAIGAVAELGTLVESTRTAAVDAIERALEDRAYLVRMAAYAAAERLADPRLLGALDRLAATENDGRLRRDAAEAAARVRDGQRTPAEVTQVREDLDRLRADQQALRERLDALDTK
ncbi:MAG: HEAT repeat domain-containing protein, partial [Vulcanimicrobiaceae bacterium]